MFEQMKGLTPKKKVEYYMQYYGLITVIILAVVAFAIYWIVHVVTAKTEVSGIIMVNAAEADEDTLDAYLDDVLTRNDYDTSKFEISAETGIYVGDNADSQSAYAGTLKIQTLLGANAADVVFFDVSYSESMLTYGAFADLNDYLTTDQLAAHEADLLYYTDEDTNETYPVAIRVNSDSDLLQEMGWYEDGDGYIGICCNVVSDEEIGKTILFDALGE